MQNKTQIQPYPRHHNKTTKQVRNAVANIFFSAIILTGVVMFFISYYVYGDYERGSYNGTGSAGNDIVDDNLTNKKPVSRWRLNKNGYSQKYIPLVGEGRDARAIELLQAYGFEGKSQWDTIKTISRIHQTYPETILCIIYADSSIGRFLKTQHNYGNVGNNDRGDTVKYQNFEQGINAVGKVLNNRYLGDYTLIGQLSPYGKMNGSPFYATSEENWGINVLNCLGMIHNKQINNDFSFRW